MISRSSRASILPRTCSPVVPASPSMNTLYLAAKRPVLVVVVVVDRRDEGANPKMLGAPIMIAAKESFMLFVILWVDFVYYYLLSDREI